eukprot:TRINITY_DN58815_c0_g1_i1.p1 TRINITY_DN58815_c0_g1~~TRINITY_DN58815_c0_g1_i1.p1  ORF type:complete len:246 (-),score=78.01 TRINITY_DN58815_c0_g1_i1:161-898(-)
MPFDVSMMGLKREQEDKKDDGEHREKKTAKGPKGKGRDADKGNVVELTKQVSKLALASARQLAVVSSAVILTILFRNEGKGLQIHDELKATTAAYTKMAKEAKPVERQALSSPHAYVWYALLSFVQKQKDQLSQEGKDSLAKHSEELKAVQGGKLIGIDEPTDEQKQVALRAAICDQIKVCRLQRCYDQTMAKLELSVDNTTTAKAAVSTIVAYMVLQAKASVKTGQAPKSDSERKVQELLDAVK